MFLDPVLWPDDDPSSGLILCAIKWNYLHVSWLWLWIFI